MEFKFHFFVSFYGSDLSNYGEEITTTDDEDYLLDGITSDKSESDIMDSTLSEPM